MYIVLVQGLLGLPLLYNAQDNEGVGEERQWSLLAHHLPELPRLVSMRPAEVIYVYLSHYLMAFPSFWVS